MAESKKYQKAFDAQFKLLMKLASPKTYKIKGVKMPRAPKLPKIKGF